MTSTDPAPGEGSTRVRVVGGDEHTMVRNGVRA